MSLLEKIKQDRHAARLARDSVAADLLGTIQSHIQTAEKNLQPSRDLNEAEIVAIIKKTNDGVLETGRLLATLVEREAEKVKNAREQDILAGLLPQQLTEAQIEASVRAITANGATNLGAIMSGLKSLHPGQYDGKLASAVAKRVIG